MAYVYRHIRLDKNEPFYIGIGSDEKYTRANSIFRRNKIWSNIVSKTGYRVEILIDGLTWEEACEKEKEFISIHGRRDLGNGTLCNLTDGGEGTIGIVVSEDLRVKMSESRTGCKNHFYGKTHTDSARFKISAAETGERNHFYGKKLSEEHRRKISKAHKGVKKSKQAIENMSKSRMGKRTGKDSHKSKIVLDLQTGIYYDCAREAGEAFGIAHSTIRGYLNGSYTNKTNLIYV